MILWSAYWFSPYFGIGFGRRAVAEIFCWPLTASEPAYTVCLTPQSRAASKQLSMPTMFSLVATRGGKSLPM